MKIVGSQTEANKFIIKLPTGLDIKLGRHENSDIDILLDKIPDDKQIFIGTLEDPDDILKYDIFIGSPIGPYIENDELFLPDSYDYLTYLICNKLFFHPHTLQHLVYSYLKPFEVFNYSKEKICEVILDPAPYFKEFPHLKVIVNRAKDYQFFKKNK